MDSWIINVEDNYFKNLFLNKILRYIGILAYLGFLLFFIIFLILDTVRNNIEILVYTIIYASMLFFSVILILIKTKKKLHQVKNASNDSK